MTKIYTRVVINMTTDQVLEEESVEYDGPLSLCCGDGDDGDDDGAGNKNKDKNKSLGSKYSDPDRKSWAKEHGVGMYGDPSQPTSTTNNPHGIYSPAQANAAFAADVAPSSMRRSGPSSGGGNGGWTVSPHSPGYGYMAGESDLAIDDDAAQAMANATAAQMAIVAEAAEDKQSAMDEVAAKANAERKAHMETSPQGIRNFAAERYNGGEVTYADPTAADIAAYDSVKASLGRTFADLNAAALSNRTVSYDAQAIHDALVGGASLESQQEALDKLGLTMSHDTFEEVDRNRAYTRQTAHEAPSEEETDAIMAGLMQGGVDIGLGINKEKSLRYAPATHVSLPQGYVDKVNAYNEDYAEMQNEWDNENIAAAFATDAPASAVFDAAEPFGFWDGLSVLKDAGMAVLNPLSLLGTVPKNVQKYNKYTSHSLPERLDYQRSLDYMGMSSNIGYGLDAIGIGLGYGGFPGAYKGLHGLATVAKTGIPGMVYEASLADYAATPAQYGTDVVPGGIDAVGDGFFSALGDYQSDGNYDETYFQSESVIPGAEDPDDESFVPNGPGSQSAFSGGFNPRSMPWGIGMPGDIFSPSGDINPWQLLLAPTTEYLNMRIGEQLAF